MTPLAPTFRWPRAALAPIRTAGRFPLDVRRFRRRYQSRTHALHLHEYAGRMRLGQWEFALRPGDLTISPARWVSSYALDAPGHHLCIHFHPVQAGGGCRIVCHQSLGPRRSHIAQRMRHIAELHARSTSPGAAGRTAAAAAAAEMQALLMELALDDPGGAPEGRRRHAPKAVRRVAQMIHDRYVEPLGADDFADEADLSQGYLAREFRRAYGMTMHAFLRRRRIEVATHLLRTTDLPIKAIARRVGIADVPYFHRQFRTVTGITPASLQREPGPTAPSQ